MCPSSTPDFLHASLYVSKPGRHWGRTGKLFWMEAAVRPPPLSMCRRQAKVHCAPLICSGRKPPAFSPASRFHSIWTAVDVFTAMIESQLLFEVEKRLARKRFQHRRHNLIPALLRLERCIHSTAGMTKVGVTCPPPLGLCGRAIGCSALLPGQRSRTGRQKDTPPRLPSDR